MNPKVSTRTANRVANKVLFFMAIVIANVAWLSTASAIDSIAFEIGAAESDEDINRFGIALKWDWNAKWLTVGDWSLGGYWEAGANFWDGDEGRTGNDSFGDFHFTNVFKYQHNTKTGIAPFVELGLGVHLHTDSEIGNKDFDIPFSFGSHFGAGAKFGPAQRYELTYRFQHLSNASLGDSNPGINFHLVHLGYRF